MNPAINRRSLTLCGVLLLAGAALLGRAPLYAPSLRSSSHHH